MSVRSLELSEHAVAWAAVNRERLGLDVEVVQGDATEQAFPDWEGGVDIVTVNPPYIPVGAVPLDPEVRDHDPELALYGGSEDGLATPVAVARTAAGLLRSGGPAAHGARGLTGAVPACGAGTRGSVGGRRGPRGSHWSSARDVSPPGLSDHSLHSAANVDGVHTRIH